jgi:ABC-type transport system involved in multi-copper enzyme maturation permease subunit
VTTTDLAPAVRPVLRGSEAVRRGTSTRPRLTFARVVRSEWIKQWTLASTRWTLLSLFVALAGFGMLAASVATGGVTDPGGGPGFPADDPLALVMSGANFGTLLVAVLGTLVGAREYGSGLVRTTYAAVPSRLSVLVAKILAFLGSVVPIVTAGVVVAFAGGMAILDSAGSASLAWSDPGVLGALAGQVAYLSALGVIGVAIGSAMRAVAGGVGVVIGGVLFVPVLAQALLPSSWSEVLKYLPSNAGASVTSLTAPDGMLAAWPAAAVLAGWVVGCVGLAAVLLRRRDV